MNTNKDIEVARSILSWARRRLPRELTPEAIIRESLLVIRQIINGARAIGEYSLMGTKGGIIYHECSFVLVTTVKDGMVYIVLNRRELYYWHRVEVSLGETIKMVFRSSKKGCAEISAHNPQVELPDMLFQTSESIVEDVWN